jgi:hypothetical protein
MDDNLIWLSVVLVTSSDNRHWASPRDGQCRSGGTHLARLEVT